MVLVGMGLTVWATCQVEDCSFNCIARNMYVTRVLKFIAYIANVFIILCLLV